MCAILEALFGQLYLVSIVAVLVANMGQRGSSAPRRRRPRSGVREPTIEGTP